MERRDFLGLTASTTAALLGQGLHAAVPTGRIKVGQIGTKHAHASGQMRTLRSLANDYEVVGVVEPDDDRREKISRDAVYAGLPFLSEDQLLDTAELQVVAIETEVSDLLPTAQRCIDAGFHIHLDKPAGESLTALQRLHNEAARKGLTIQMGYMFRYNPAFQFLFAAARDGWLGQIFEVHGVMSKTVDSATRRELAQFRGGSMFELGCHLIDPLLHLMGAPRSVTGYLKQTRPQQDSLYDNTLAVFDFGIATATIRSTVVEVEGGSRRQFVVCGDRGTVAIQPLEPPSLQLTLSQPQGNFRRGRQQVTLHASRGRYHGAWQDLARVIRGEKTHEFSHAHDLAVQASLLQACGYSVNS